MRKIGRIEKIAWSIALRFAAVKDQFEYTQENKADLVRNPNPKGRKEWVTQDYADQFRSSPSKPTSQEPKTSAPPPGKERAEFNRRRCKEIKESGQKNTNKFIGMDEETRKRAEAISKKKGSEVTLDDVVEFVGYFESAYEESQTFAEAFLDGGAKIYSGRWKDEESLFNKMQGRFKNRSLETVGDIIGNRCVCKNAQDQKRLVDYIYENCVILEHDNSVDGEIRDDGYRAHHFTIQSSDGRLIELQVKTSNQQLYSGFTHPIYKSPLIEKDEKGKYKYPEVEKYTKALSDYIYAVDSGQNPTNPPKAPEIVLKWLRENGHPEFNFEDLKR